jgi:hypothetical protein
MLSSNFMIILNAERYDRLHGKNRAEKLTGIGGGHEWVSHHQLYERVLDCVIDIMDVEAGIVATS